MFSRKVFLVSITIASLAVFISMTGCGSQNDSELKLPEQEIKQMAAADGTPGPKTDKLSGAKVALQKGEFKKVFVYADQGYFKNHFIPSGWMGDFGDIKFSDASNEQPFSRKSCIKVVYTAQKKQGAGWAGIYWQDPANNWGNLKGGYDLTGAKKLTFYARGAKGGEIISEFKVGGINGEHSDTASSGIGPVTLTPEWKQYTIDLKDEDLSLVIGAFSFTVSSMENPGGATFYLDDIAFE